MKVGDIVKRSNIFKEWMKHNSWMSLEEEQEIGMIIRFDNDDVVVLWPVVGESWENKKDLEIVLARIAKSLEKLKVDVIEAGFPIASDGDFKAVQEVSKNIKDSIICALARAIDKDIESDVLAFIKKDVKKFNKPKNKKERYLPDIFKISIALNVISSRFPMGVETI